MENDGEWLAVVCVSILLYWLLVERLGVPAWLVVIVGLVLIICGAIQKKRT